MNIFFNRENFRLKSFLVPLFLFITFSSVYISTIKTIPISFWDEIHWVGTSYFFDFIIHGDFGNRAWKSRFSYDQPQLTRYVYGAWLYPSYFLRKNKTNKPSDFTEFLIQNNFYVIDEHYLNDYESLKDKYRILWFDQKDIGPPEFYLEKYGSKALDTIGLIYKARLLNALLLAGSVIFAYFLLCQFTGATIALFYAIIYGFNSLIINTGLKAHSEALFLFTFNGAFLFMNLYFKRKRNRIHLLLFSLFAGLCMATKLNGFMLAIIFFVSNLILSLIFHRFTVKKIALSAAPAIISLFVFILLNPFTYPNPIKNIKFMYDWRLNVASEQAISFQEMSLLDVNVRLAQIFKNFYFSDKASLFNGLRIFYKLSTLKNYGIYLFVLSLLGFLFLLKRVFARNITEAVIICSFLTVLLLMSFYLLLDWSRYYVHLSLFFVLFQVLGIYSTIIFLYRKIKSFRK